MENKKAIIAGVIGIGLLGTSRFMSNSTKKEIKTNKEKKEEISQFVYTENRSTYNINYNNIKGIINNSMHNQDINGLEHGLKILNEFIEGYTILNDKLNNLDYLKIGKNLEKLNNIRIQTYNNLGCIYQDLSLVDSANLNYLQSLKYCNFNNSNHVKIIKKNITLLINNDYIM